MKVFLLICICFVANSAFGQNFGDLSDEDKAAKLKGVSKKDLLRARAQLEPNCECQCNSYTWSDGRGNTHGNCNTKDNTGALFCYIDGEARGSCNDVRPSGSQQGKFYSYQACATPTRNTCIISFYNQEKTKYRSKSGQYNPNAFNCLTNLGSGNQGGFGGGNQGGFGGNQGGFGGNQGGFGNGGFGNLGGVRGKGSGTTQKPNIGAKSAGITFDA